VVIVSLHPSRLRRLQFLMSTQSPPNERQPLVQDTPHNDYESVTSTTVDEQQVEEDVDEATISRKDLIWILCGLYSAVFLGALDGERFR
jgi:hypothetical protein